jgi:hypothetical protein
LAQFVFGLAQVGAGVLEELVAPTDQPGLGFVHAALGTQHFGGADVAGAL